MDGPRIDAPRTNRDPEELARKRELLREPRLAPLVEFVERLRAQRPDSDVPDFDPTQASVDARVLLLLEAPGRRGASVTQGSGFISPDNDDQTAQNTWELMREAGLDRRIAINWNVVPWYVGSESKLDNPRDGEVRAAAPALRRLLALLGELRVVVLVGKTAQGAWDALGTSRWPDEMRGRQRPEVLRAPHPSPRNLNSRPASRALILEAFTEAARLAGEARPG